LIYAANISLPFGFPHSVLRQYSMVTYRPFQTAEAAVQWVRAHGISCRQNDSDRAACFERDDNGGRQDVGHGVFVRRITRMLKI
jgi:hypothetical protein